MNDAQRESLMDEHDRLVDEIGGIEREIEQLEYELGQAKRSLERVLQQFPEVRYVTLETEA